MTLACLTPAAAQGTALTELFMARQIHESYPTDLAALDIGENHLVLTVGWDGYLKHWNGDGGEELSAIPLSSGRLHRVIVHTGVGNKAFVAGDDGLYIFDIDGERLEDHLLVGTRLRHLAAAPFSDVVYAADASGRVYAVSLSQRLVLDSWSASDRTPVFMRLARQGAALLVADTQAIRLFNAETGVLADEYRPLPVTEPISTLAFNPELDVLYLGHGRQVSALDVLTGSILTSFVLTETVLVALEVSGPRKLLLAASRSGEVALWDLDQGLPVYHANYDEERFSRWTFSTDHNRLYSLTPVVNYLGGWRFDTGPLPD